MSGFSIDDLAYLDDGTVVVVVGYDEDMDQVAVRCLDGKQVFLVDAWDLAMNSA